MESQMTKAKLLKEMRAARQEWEDLLHEVSEERMNEPGATSDWSVKNVITHLSSYARWYMNATEAQLQDKLPPFDGTEQMPIEERNQLFYERDKDMPLERALRESREIYERLLAAVEKLPETFLIEPQYFPGSTQPSYVWQMLESDVYEHTRIHIQWIRN